MFFYDQNVFKVTDRRRNTDFSVCLTKSFKIVLFYNNKFCVRNLYLTVDQRDTETRSFTN